MITHLVQIGGTRSVAILLPENSILYRALKTPVRLGPQQEGHYKQRKNSAKHQHKRENITQLDLTMFHYFAASVPGMTVLESMSLFKGHIECMSMSANGPLCATCGNRVVLTLLE